MNKHYAFLNGVNAYIKEHPEAAAYVSDAVSAGIREALEETRHRAADMEVALSVAIAARWKGRAELVLSKLRRWNGKSAIPWDDAIKMLEGEKK